MLLLQIGLFMLIEIFILGNKCDEKVTVAVQLNGM